MKTLVKSLRILFAFVLVSTMAACATNGSGYLTETMDDDDFIRAKQDQKEAYLKAVVDEATALQWKKDTEYSAGRPVPYGDEKTGYTLHWDNKLLLVHIYPGHSNGMMGIDEEALLTLQTDEKGNIKYQELANGMGGTYQKPTIFLANVATQEGLGRVLLKGGIQVGSSFMNGGYAADKYADAECGNNCGNIYNGSMSQSLAEAAANVTANAAAEASGGCATGTCAPRR
ncbi:hypothetical protein KC850_02315 [Candidatus Kaiserbacteria bacterium]|nr:hypothetical protein [Candidatus Kaiserbacteria bacterium]MCB9818095.1 hypothetical protein [Candidatus Nomurabacteria bacterium]